MDALLIEGDRPLRGAVRTSGAKNAALPLMAASLLTDQPVRLTNLPRVVDIRTMGRLLGRLGVEVGEFEEEGRGGVRLRAERLSDVEAPYDLVRTMRASILVLGPLLARTGRARVSLPGGCAIGTRPIDLHLRALRHLGARVELKEGYVEAAADRLRGAPVYFDQPTVTGTENVLMAAALAEGCTTLKNAAREPEVVELARAVEAMGARIEGAGTDTIAVEGAPRLKGLDWRILPDRIEAGTWMVGAAITGGSVEVRDCEPQHLTALMAKLEDCGIEVQAGEGFARIEGRRPWKPTDLRTAPYPGFPTDMQAQMMALLSLAQGRSVVTETIFENRFMHAMELVRMGADIRLDGNQATVRGVAALKGAPVMATDLRASASLVLAGLAAQGTTRISRVYHLDRGYERMDEKLAGLGARIERVSR